MPGTVLIVATCYPPVAAMGSVRLASFVRHLPTFGWQPHVVTAGAGGRRVDPSLPAGGDDSRILRTPALDISVAVTALSGRARRYGVSRAEAASDDGRRLTRIALRLYDEVFAFPDPMWPWYHAAKASALRFARAHPPDVILSSSPHPTAHRLGRFLRQRLQRPWIAEFRDPWSETWLDPSSQRRRRAVALETTLLRSASAICAASPAVAESAGRLHGKPTFVVTNGFEPDEHDGALPAFETFTIVYTGMIYPGRRDPRPVLAAVARLARRDVVRPGSLRLLFCGPNHDLTARMARDLGVEAFVECRSALPRAEALALQQRASLLLQIEWNDDAARGAFTGKFFEYLGAGRPILAIGPPGSVVGRVLAQTGRGRMATTADEIEVAIEQALREPRVGRADPRAPELAPFTRGRQAATLAGHLDAIRGSAAP